MRRPPVHALERLVPRDAVAPPDSVAELAWWGVAWSRLGRGDLAFSCWSQVPDPALAPWLDIERGRVLRELGLHGAAEGHDRTAADAAIDPVDRAAAAIGLTADAVGRGDPGLARARLADARAHVAACPAGPRGDRQRLRLAWVVAECAWLAGRPAPRNGLPTWGAGRPRFPVTYEAEGDFHRAKGLLFAGVADRDHRLLAAAQRLAPPALAWAVALARADRGESGADAEARHAWSRVVAPPAYAAAVAATSTARRLSGADPIGP